MGRRENKTELLPVPKSTFFNLISEIKVSEPLSILLVTAELVLNRVFLTTKDSEVEIKLNEEIEETRNALERTDTDSAMKAKEDKEAMSEHEKHLTLLKSQEEEQTKNQAVAKSDALIVAALMGSTIVRMNRNRNKRFNTQMSAPVTIINSPVFNADSATQSQVIDERSSLNLTVSTRIEKSKSLNEHEANKMIEMNMLSKPAEYHLKSEGASPRTSSSSNLKSAGTKTNKTSQSSKALKCTLISLFLFNFIILRPFFSRRRRFLLFFFDFFLSIRLDITSSSFFFSFN